MFHFYILIPQHLLATTHMHVQQSNPPNKPYICHYALGRLKFPELYLGYYHITGQASKKGTALVQPSLGRGDVEVTALTNNNNNNTYWLSNPSLASSWQTKNKTGYNSNIPVTTLNGPGFIHADIATPGLASNCCSGNGLNHVHIME